MSLPPQAAADLLCPRYGATVIFIGGDLAAYRVSGQPSDAVTQSILERSELPLRGRLTRPRSITRNLSVGRDQGRPISEWSLPGGMLSVWVVGEVDPVSLEEAAAVITLHHHQLQLSCNAMTASGAEPARPEFVGRAVLAVQGESSSTAWEVRRCALAAVHQRGLIVHEESDRTYFLDDSSGSLRSDLGQLPGVTCGVSAPLVAGQTIYAARQQADIALGAAGEMEVSAVDAGTLEGWLVCAEKVALDAIASSALAVQNPLSELEQDPALLTTLRANLSAPGRPKETSAALMLHVNSLRYRLRKIEGVLGISADDPRLKHALRVSELFVSPETDRQALQRSA